MIASARDVVLGLTFLVLPARTVRRMADARRRGWGMNRDARTVFDGNAFRAAVIAYMDRWHLSGRVLFQGAGIGVSEGLAFLRGDREPSLLMACALADVCDLSLDDYRRTS